ncbi:MAG: hypothetical protein ACTSU2_13045 [Promethearchaeota archaeon]
MANLLKMILLFSILYFDFNIIALSPWFGIFVIIMEITLYSNLKRSKKGLSSRIRGLFGLGGDEQEYNNKTGTGPIQIIINPKDEAITSREDIELILKRLLGLDNSINGGLIKKELESNFGNKMLIGDYIDSLNILIDNSIKRGDINEEQGWENEQDWESEQDRGDEEIFIRTNSEIMDDSNKYHRVNSRFSNINHNVIADKSIMDLKIKLPRLKNEYNGIDLIGNKNNNNNTPSNHQLNIKYNEGYLNRAEKSKVNELDFIDMIKWNGLNGLRNGILVVFLILSMLSLAYFIELNLPNIINDPTIFKIMFNIMAMFITLSFVVLYIWVYLYRATLKNEKINEVN